MTIGEKQITEVDEEHLETIENAQKALAKLGIKDLLLVVTYEDGTDRALFAGDVKALHQSVDFEVNFNDFVEKGYIDPDHLDWKTLEKNEHYIPCPENEEDPGMITSREGDGDD